MAPYIRLQCSGGHHIFATQADAGKTGKCPRCGVKISVPDMGDPRAASFDDVPNAPVDTATPAVTSENTRHALPDRSTNREPGGLQTEDQQHPLGELYPLNSRRAIKLSKRSILVGRRRDCDVVLAHGDISGHHCELFIRRGYWYVHDLESTNGTAVNHVQVQDKRVMPGDRLDLGTHVYELRYHPEELGATGVLGWR